MPSSTITSATPGARHDSEESVRRVMDEETEVFNVPEQEKGEVLAAFAVHKGEVTEGYLE
jgi:hypothetical protein